MDGRRLGKKPLSEPMMIEFTDVYMCHQVTKFFCPLALNSDTYSTHRMFMDMHGLEENETYLRNSGFAIQSGRLAQGRNCIYSLC